MHAPDAEPARPLGELGDRLGRQPQAGRKKKMGRQPLYRSPKKKSKKTDRKKPDATEKEKATLIEEGKGG